MPVELNENLSDAESTVEWIDGDEPEGDEEPGAFTSEDLEAESNPDAPDEHLVKLSEEEEALLTNDVLRARAEAKKPDIFPLRSALDAGGNFIPRKGDYVIIERRRAHFDGHAWLDTRVYRLTENPAPDGDLALWDPVRMQHARSNWKVGLGMGFDFRLPPAGRNPETCLESGGKRRKRKKVLADKPAPAPSTTTSDGKKRGRGRPPGTKNRPKEVVQAEKKARLEERRAKKAARVARKLSK